MKIFTLLFLLLTFSKVTSQSLPIDFETTITTDDFVDFDGGTATVIPNPQISDSNTSMMVAQIVRDGGQVWAGSKINLDANLDFSTLNSITMKVFTTAPIGTTVKFKLEGTESTERDVQTTVSNEWEELTWDFTGTPANFNSIVFMFDFGNIGNGSSSSTFLFDDIQQLFGGTQIDLPVDFEGSTVNYNLTDFEGNFSLLAVDPTDASNTVVQSMKTGQASPSAGVTIGTPSGFASDIPLSLTNSKMNVRVWSPEAGTPIRLKVEDSNDPTHTCETETNTTVGGAWETLEFDFLDQAPGTELLSVGLSMGWTYNMASIFFDFGTGGSFENETYYFDDVKFGQIPLSTDWIIADKINVFPNPSNGQWNINSEVEVITQIDIHDINGSIVQKVFPKNSHAIIDNQNLNNKIYIAKISTETGTRMVKLLKK